MLSLGNSNLENVKKGIAYSLKDCFENNDFNMLFA